MSRVRVPLPAPTASSDTVPIFNRGASPAPATSGPSDSPGSRRQITHIAAGTLLQGAVTGATELLVEGEIQGEVRVDAPVTVGVEGVVEGPIAAPVVRISGRVTGNVAATDRVEVAASGILEGDIAAPRIVIAEGAFFKGRVEMRGEKPKPAS
ncbi:MAG TPA: polymer-forming cytoskeletal protein [Thermoanaerobaculia bacterium]